MQYRQAGAGDLVDLANLLDHLGDRLQLLLVHRLKVGHGGDVVFKLLLVAHAAEHNGNLRQRSNPANCPACNRAIWLHLQKRFGALLIDGGKIAAAHRLHDHYRQVALFQLAVELLGALVLPVEIVQLNLDKVPVVVVEDLGEDLIGVVEGEAQVLDLALTLHLLQKFHAVEILYLL